MRTYIDTYAFVGSSGMDTVLRIRIGNTDLNPKLVAIKLIKYVQISLLPNLS
jgi:hypothetical protein